MSEWIQSINNLFRAEPELLIFIVCAVVMLSMVWTNATSNIARNAVFFCIQAGLFFSASYFLITVFL